MDAYSSLEKTINLIENKIFIKTAKVCEKNFPRVILHDKIRKIYIHTGFFMKTVIEIVCE